MNYPPPGQHMAPPFRPQTHRQRSDYQHPSPGFYPPQPHYPYPPYQQPPHYPVPPHPGYPPPWYQPYPMQYAPQPPPRFYQPPPQSPHMPMPPRPHPMPQSGPPPFQSPQPTRTPQPETSTPSTTSQAVTSPSTTPTPASVNNSTPPAPTPKQSAATPVVASSTPSTAARSATPVQFPSPAQSELSPTRVPFYPALPWTSVPSSDFPSAFRRRRRKQQIPLSSQEVQLPSRQQSQPVLVEPTVAEDAAPTPVPDTRASVDGQIEKDESLEKDEHIEKDEQHIEKDEQHIEEGEHEKDEQTENHASSEAPTSSDAPAPVFEMSETIPAPTPAVAASTFTFTPPLTTTKPTQGHHRRSTTKPVVPVVPLLPRARQSQAAPKAASPPAPAPPALAPIHTKDAASNSTEEAKATQDETHTEADQVSSPASPPPAAVPVKAVPKSWAELFARKQAASGAGSAPQGTTTPVANGSPVVPRTGTLGEVLQAYSVSGDNKLPFLEPRGLINTGNMCYMNSILQVLVFCVPFYDFLDQIGKRVAHSFKSNTPLIEAMIMFMREYKVIDAATSVEQLRMRLKDTELEQYGDSFAPEYVYDVIKRLPRFSSMRRGHQQDAEEFLGFLLEGLHDECVQIMKSTAGSASSTPSTDGVASPVSERSGTANGAIDSGWLEVGPKQKAAVTQSSGAIATESPVTKIFGGKLRSVLRVPGLKDSVTLEPYQPLQLDIGGANVNNITDALKGLTHSETLHGAFNSPRGPGTTATKQVFIETLPPVLILHLKRFQYDNAGGTQKIWRKIGYPLDLELPKEVFPQHQRANLQMRPGGLPKYRLISVVYHHGKSASGGHYTVDVRRQEGREWIRIDDTVIRRIRADDVAHEGSEEDPKILAKALEQHKQDSEEAKSNANVYSQAFGGDEDGGEDSADKGGWSHVNGATPTATAKTDKKWSAVANTNGTTGASTPNTNTTGRSTPKASAKYSVKDNKIAYILFYQRI